ncbi:glycosyl transferase [Citrobacter sp. NCU1]|uniref:glycosyltransferase n=1 Tax=Citrobacter sp. NCU1 TaxID=2026683 RepID=UPI0013919291|nr:glycosyltransferase [Citrobacter sp. NCU1]NDO83692.1 glycosyl transferase [Citrobacter sp. NCU1]
MLLIALLWLFILLFKLFFALRILRAAHRHCGGDLHTVTVMQPILSGDPALESVLASTVGQLRGAEFLWLIDDDDTAALQITRRLQLRYPRQHITILSYPQAPEGVNPKLFKLEQARAQVTRDVILVLDDDAILSAESLCDMLDALTEKTLVTALPWYDAAENSPSRLLAQFVNDNSALTYLPLLPFSPPLTLNGMCYAIRGETLERVGGFSPVLRHLTDDLAMATLLTRHGVRIVQSVAPVRVQTSIADAKGYFRQMHRWFLFATLLMREKSAAINLTIFLLQGLHPLLLWALLIMAFGGTAQFALLLGIFVIRHLALRYVQRAVAAEIPSHPLLSLLSELLQPLHLLNALVNRTIYWRSRRYRIFSNDCFTSR